MGYAINDAGQIAGSGFVTNLSGQVVSLGGTGQGINAFDQVTGVYTAANGLDHAFDTNVSEEMIDLGTIDGSLYSWGNGINNSGQVSGFSGLNAFITESNGQLISLGMGSG